MGYFTIIMKQNVYNTHSVLGSVEEKPLIVSSDGQSWFFKHTLH
jgi:hypothetical protein